MRDQEVVGHLNILNTEKQITQHWIELLKIKPASMDPLWEAPGVVIGNYMLQLVRIQKMEERVKGMCEHNSVLQLHSLPCDKMHYCSVCEQTVGHNLLEGKNEPV